MMNECDDCPINTENAFAGLDCVSMNCDVVKEWFKKHDEKVKGDTINEARKICGIKGIPMPPYCDGCKMAILEQGTFIECGLDKIMRGNND